MAARRARGKAASALGAPRPHVLAIPFPTCVHDQQGLQDMGQRGSPGLGMGEQRGGRGTEYLLWCEGLPAQLQQGPPQRASFLCHQPRATRAPEL